MCRPHASYERGSDIHSYPAVDKEFANEAAYVCLGSSSLKACGRRNED